MTRPLIGIVSLLVRWVRRRQRPGIHPGAWMADEDDQAAIGDPLARIAARHAPIGGEGSADMVDAGAMLVGTAGYALKSFELEAAPYDQPEEDEPGG